MNPVNTEKFCALGVSVIETELKAIQALVTRIDHHFSVACELMLNCQGRVVVLGMGKSGHIGNKIAATLASTGTPAFFVHPGEANHGDMGMITAQDVVLAISNSGETPEILNLIPFIKRFSIPLIVLTGGLHSTLAQNANACLDVSVSEEACPLGLAPTSSTTATLVMGDALAIALLETRGFTQEDFALFHPGGALGRRLLLKVANVMHTDHHIPRVRPDCLLNEALMEMTQKRLGMTTIVDENDRLLGIFTDGDLRRTLDQHTLIHHLKIQEVMTATCLTIEPKLLAVEALRIMNEKKITSLIVINQNRQPIGIVHLHDLLKAGVA